ncbi:MAG: mandelate racemase/muconate lactonizing enzyme family protein [Hyphomicrobiaceae bacterium]
MQIAAIKAQRYRSTESTLSPSTFGSEIIVVEIATDDGETGLGFTTGSGVTGNILVTLVEDVITPVIVGRNPRSFASLWQDMYEAIPRRGGDGLMRYAIAAVDFAIWDIRGKAQGVPVWQLLGSERRLVPTYANCAHHLPPDKLAERAAGYVAKGHRALKIRGNRKFVTVAEATARVQAVREAIGPDVRLMVDVNGTWDVDTAIQQLKAWEKFDIYWLEEPVPPHDVEGYVRIKERAGDTNIAGGEQHVGCAEFKSLIASRGIDIVQPNAAVTGGITDWLRVHNLATSAGIPVSPWNLQQVHIHLAAGLQNVQWIEYFMADNALLKFQSELLAGSQLEETVTDEGVFLNAPEAPGLGLVLEADVAGRTRIG